MAEPSRKAVEELLYLMREAFEGAGIEETGEERPTRWLIAAMITHDAYAGEINHLRSLMSGDDRWMFVRETEGERLPEEPARSGSTPQLPG